MTTRRWSPPLLLMLTVIWAGLSCNDPNLEELSYSGGTLADLMIDLTPTVLDFGHVEVNAQRVLDLTISNIGTRTLRFESLEIDRDSHFYLGTLSSETLAPGDSLTLAVRYAPLGYEAAAANLLINTNDPILSQATVGLAGRCDPPRVTLVPPVYDFGIAYVGCELAQPLALRNEGDGTLNISGLDFQTSSEALRLDWGGVTAPLELAPGEEIALNALFTPLEDREDAATLTITSNDPETPLYEGRLMGVGHSAGLITDKFNVDANGKVDILFVIDNSGSMSDNQTTLASNFENFYYIIESLSLDWQIGIVTTDNGVLQGEIKLITPNTADVQSVFSANALVGIMGSGDEQGLEFAYRALSEPLVNGQNRGFLRDNAGLHLIMLSDEEDHSLKSVDFYVSYFQSLKVNPSLVQISAITGGQQGCNVTNCGAADAATRYYAAVDATGGVQASICDCDFIHALEVLAEASQVYQDTFPLSQDPVVSTIEVTVDGAVSTNWAYDTGLNAIVFASVEVTPQNGETVIVDYALNLDCAD